MVHFFAKMFSRDTNVRDRSCSTESDCESGTYEDYVKEVERQRQKEAWLLIQFLPMMGRVEVIQIQSVISVIHTYLHPTTCPFRIST